MHSAPPSTQQPQQNGMESQSPQSAQTQEQMPGSEASGGEAPSTSNAPAVSVVARDITKPCSMISASEVGPIVGFSVVATDEQYRCKFTDGKNGYLTVKLMEAQLKAAKDICEYAPSKRTQVAGVGDSASYLGSTACVKVGDVAIIVDGANVAEHSAQLGKSGADNVFILIGKTIAGRIP
jgi:hypothetical protein